MRLLTMRVRVSEPLVRESEIGKYTQEGHVVSGHAVPDYAVGQRRRRLTWIAAEVRLKQPAPKFEQDVNRIVTHAAPVRHPREVTG